VGLGIDNVAHDATGLRIGIVAARWNAALVEPMLASAVEELRRLGTAAVRVIRVPGAFELPYGAKCLMADGDCDAIVALGAVVRGDTPHFDFVAGECARGIARLNLSWSHDWRGSRPQPGPPVIFGVLTTDTVGQAEERADPERMDKGAEAARSAVEMARLRRNCADDIAEFEETP